MCKGGVGPPKLGILGGNDFVLQPPLSPRCSSGTTVFPNLRHFQLGRAGEHFCKHIREEPAMLGLWGPAPPGFHRKRLQLAGSLGSPSLLSGVDLS